MGGPFTPPAATGTATAAPTSFAGGGPFTPPTVSSSLGTPGLGSYPGPGGVQPSNVNGGNTGWLGSWTDPLGLRTGFTRIASGLASAAGGEIEHGIGFTANTLTGQFGKAASDLRGMGQGVGDFGAGIVTGTESLVGTGASLLGGQPADSFLNREVFQPFNKFLAGVDAKDGHWDSVLSPQMAQALYNGGQGMAPADWWTDASKHGIGAATLNTAGQVAVVAGVGTGLTAGLAGNAAELGDLAAQSGAVEEAAAYAAKADRFNQMNSVLGKVAKVTNDLTNPLGLVGGKTADLLSAMRAKAYPADLPVTAEANPEAPVAPELLVTARDQMAPQTAAAEAMAQGNDSAYAVSPDLLKAQQEAVQAASGTPEEIAPPAPGTTRLYRRGQNGNYWSTNPDTVAVGNTVTPDRLQHTDVPNEVLAGVASRAHGDFTQYDLSEVQDAQAAAVEHPTVSPGETKPAEKVGATIEPRNYSKAGAGQPVTPEELAARQDQLRSDTAAAREAVNPPLWVFDQLGKRLNMPTPTWATELARMLPDSVNRLLGRVGANFVDQVRFRNLYRNAMQAMETAQKQAQTSPAMLAATDAATILLSSKVARPIASAMVGQEIHARLNGEAVLAEWAKLHGPTLTEEQRASFMSTARGGYRGIDQGTLDQLSPEEALQLEMHLQAAVAGFKVEAKNTLDTLLASRFGAKGLEAALLGPNELPMTAEQLRMYRRSERDLQFAAKARAKIPNEVARREADAARADAAGARWHGAEDTLRAKLGLTLQTIDDLYRGVPKGLENDGRATIALGIDTLQREGGALIDVGLGTVEHPTEGMHVPIGNLFDIPLDPSGNTTYLASAIHDAMFNPTGEAGRVYDPQTLWGGPDARLSVNIATGADGQLHAVGSLSMHTVNGEAMAPWQAYVIGTAHNAGAAFNFGTGNAMRLSTDPNEVNLMMHYAADARDPKSGLYTWATNRTKVISDNNLNITNDQLHAEMVANLTLDHIMSQKYGQWKQGDIFNTKLEFGKGPISLDHLAQTILPQDTTAGHVDRAMESLDLHTVNTALAWYYGGHNFIESTWRANADGEELIVPLTGRSAAETAYDLFALTSVLADPTTNLGRVLAGFSNLDDMIKSKNGNMDEVRRTMDELLGKSIPNDVIYVKDIGKTTEREVPKGTGGTAVSRRWMQSEIARPLSDTLSTSMVTSQKYRIIDALLGRFNLASATPEDIGMQPEFWGGNTKTFSPENLPPENVITHARLLGLSGPELEAYTQWAADHARISGAADVRAAAGRDYVNPITDTQDVERKAAEATAAAKGSSILGGREVSAHEYQNLAMDGRQFIESARANSTPHVLDTPELRHAAYLALQPSPDPEVWPGVTLDAHTGQAIPADYHGDTYSVSAKDKGQESVTVPIGASEKVFNRGYTSALKRFGTQLNSEGGHIGIFENQTTGKIEFDPVYHTTNVHDTEAVGTYTHANGGAYNFRTENAYWTPHVRDDETWTNQTAAKRDVAASEARGLAIAQSPAMRPAYNNAMTEYHGSALLSKMKAFRDNLAHPETSLAVTLDSVMAQVFGYGQTHWGLKGEVQKYSDQIRENAAQWAQIRGGPVQPHEIQALLWIYAKRWIASQDNGRLLAHVRNAHDTITAMEDAAKNGPITVKNFDPFGSWHNENLQFSRDQLAVRTERKALNAARTAKTITPEQQARLDYLNTVPTRQTSTVQVLDEQDRPTYGPAFAQRDETSFDANTLRGMEAQRAEYIKNYLGPIRKAIKAGDFEKAHSLVDEFAARQSRSIMSGREGATFGPDMIQNNPKGTAAQALRNLRTAQHVPSPNLDGIQLPELLSKFGDTVRGATIINPDPLGQILMRLYATGDITTLLHEDLHAFRLHAPGDEIAAFEQTYPHIQDPTLTPERVQAEEHFVEDFMGYLRTGKGPPSLSQMFNSVVDTLEQHYGAGLNTEWGKAVPQSMVDHWDALFNQDIQRPNVADDPLYNPTTYKGVNPQQLRGETPAAYAQRVRQYGEARGQATVLQQRIADTAARARQADTFANKMHGLVLEPTTSEIVAQKLEGRATRTLGKLADQLQGATGKQIPRGWQPMMAAVERLKAEFKDDPSMAPYMDEIPQNFEQVLRFAAERGFEPTYMPVLTWEMAQKYLFGHLQLGANAEEAGMRKESHGTLTPVAVRNLQSLGAGSVMAMKELLQSRLTQFVEENYARKWAPMTPLPDGWVPWEPTRDAIITGRRISDNATVAVNSDKIIPQAVFNAFKAMEKPAQDVPFRFLFKGPAIAVWKHLILTYSPTWYIKHFIGTVSLATAEGVRLTDWRTAWRQFKTDSMPAEARGRAVYQAIDDETGKLAGELISRNKVAGTADLIRSEGVKSAVHEVNNKMRNVVKTVDSLGRAAVYARTLRTGGSIEEAASRAYEATGDFGRLSPIERGMVSSIFPFYSFTKAMMRLLIRMPVDHPLAAGILTQLGIIQQQLVREQLHGSLPSNYFGASMIDGHLMRLDKLNPLVDSLNMTSPDGIAAALNPFVKLFAQDALHSPSFGAQAGMDANGNLVPAPDIFHSILSTYTNPIPGLGGGLPSVGITSGLSDVQLQQLVKRVDKAQTAASTVAHGGYLDLTANKASKTAATGGTTGGTTSGATAAALAGGPFTAPKSTSSSTSSASPFGTPKASPKPRAPRKTSSRARVYRPRVRRPSLPHPRKPRLLSSLRVHTHHAYRPRRPKL